MAHFIKAELLQSLRNSVHRIKLDEKLSKKENQDEIERLTQKAQMYEADFESMVEILNAHGEYEMAREIIKLDPETSENDKDAMSLMNLETDIIHLEKEKENLDDRILRLELSIKGAKEHIKDLLKKFGEEAADSKFHRHAKSVGCKFVRVKDDLILSECRVVFKEETSDEEEGYGDEDIDDYELGYH